MTAPFKLQLEITADASGVRSATSAAKADIGALGKEARGTASEIRAYSAALQASEVAARRASEAARGAAAAERDLQAIIDRSVGVGVNRRDAARGPFSRPGMTAQEIAGYGAELDALQRQYDPLFAAAERYRRELSEIDRALRTGAIGYEAQRAAIAEVTAEYRRAADAALRARESASFRAEVDTRFGIGASGRDEARAALGLSGDTASEIAGYGAELDRLRAKYNPLFAASKQYEAELEEINRAHRVGAISTQEQAAAIDLLNARYQSAAVAGQASAASTRLNAMQMQNMAFQFNDLAVMLASGQSPFVTITQQGAQMAQIFAPGTGLGGALRATGAALLTFVTNPLNLAVVGFAGATAAATYFFSSLRDESSDADRVLQRHADLIRDLKDAYGDAIDGLDSYAGKARSLDVFTADLRSNVRAQAELLQAETAEALRSIFVAFVSTSPEGQVELTAGFDAYFASVERLRDQARQGQPDIAAFRDEIARIANANPSSPILQAIYDRLVDITGQAQAAATALREAEGAAGALSRLGTSDPRYAGYVGDTFRHFEMRQARARLASELGQLTADEEREAERRRRELEREVERALRDADRERQAWSNALRAQDERIERLRTEISLIGESTEARARALALMDAEQEIARLGPARTEEARAQAQALREQAVAAADLEVQLERTRNAWNDIERAGSGAIDSLLDGLTSGSADVRGILEGIAKDLGRTFLDLSIGNPLKNALYGSNLGTLPDVGGVGGFIGALFGGGLPGTAASAVGAGHAVGAMNVTAGTVMINGGVLGGGLGSLFGATGAGTGQLPAIGGGGMSVYRDAIAAIESAGSGGYSALGPVTESGDRAYGRYQVMGSNIPTWSMEALGRSISPQQFLASPTSQDQIFDHQFGSYLGRYGNVSDAASMWFTGRPLSGGAEAVDMLGTTGADYVKRFGDALQDITNGSLPAASEGLGGLGNSAMNAASSLANLVFGGSGGSGLFNIFGHAISPAVSAAISSGAGGLFEGGGWTGNAPVSTIAGYVHGQEYVFSAPATAKLGVSYLDGLHRSARGYQSGGFVGSHPAAAANLNVPHANENSDRQEARQRPTLSVTFNVNTADAGSFLQAESQIQAMLSRAAMRGRRNL